jgi:hypothetical protein
MVWADYRDFGVEIRRKQKDRTPIHRKMNKIKKNLLKLGCTALTELIFFMIGQI